MMFTNTNITDLPLNDEKQTEKFVMDSLIALDNLMTYMYVGFFKEI